MWPMGVVVVEVLDEYGLEVMGCLIRSLLFHQILGHLRKRTRHRAARLVFSPYHPVLRSQDRCRALRAVIIAVNRGPILFLIRPGAGSTQRKARHLKGVVAVGGTAVAKQSILVRSAGHAADRTPGR